MLNTDGDLGRHLTLGRTILASHEIPTRDILSFTKAGEPRPAYEWLAQVLLAAAYNALGLDGVVILTALVIAASFAVVYADSVKRSGAPILALFDSGVGSRGLEPALGGAPARLFFPAFCDLAILPGQTAPRRERAPVAISGPHAGLGEYAWRVRIRLPCMRRLPGRLATWSTCADQPACEWDSNCCW